MQRADHRERRTKTWTRCSHSRLRALCLLVFSVQLGSAVSEPTDSDVFAFYHEGAKGCLGVQGSTLQISAACGEQAQQWKWVSRGRLYNLGASMCLGLAGGVGEGAEATLGAYVCDREPPRVRWSWHCKLVLESLNMYLTLPLSNSTQVATPAARETAEGHRWRLRGTGQDLCTKTYREIYTIQGNSHGRPCYLPFLYDGQWFHSCTNTGREDGHLWCATTYDYSKDERWGFCPIKSNNCETFWDTDPVTNSCYQFNFQSTLSWNEARASCRQQASDLLSITEVHEQTYINGLLTGYSASLWIGLNDLDINGGWQWADSSPLKYLNWEPEQPSHGEEENCAVIRTETLGHWQNRDCSMALPYICKKKPNATLDPFSTDSWVDEERLECDVGWQSFQAGCYRLTADKETWEDALKTCQKMEANLVSIHTLSELEFIIRNLKKGVDELWIGLHDTKMQMNFEWSDRTPVIFTYWHPFEPNNFQNTKEDCVTMWGPEGRWNDGPCNLTLPSICKKLAQKPERHKQDHGCKVGWRWHSPSCYWVGEESVTYDEARKTCASKEATLVTITNRFEQAFVNSLMFGRTKDYFWTALHDQNSTGTFRWLSGDEVTYTNWNRDYPGFGKGGCVALATGYATGLWEVKDCSSMRAKYICRLSLDSSLSPELPAPAPTPSLTGSCPQGWKSSNTLHHCYRVFHFSQQEQKMSWVQAHLFCRKYGAHLLSIGSTDEEQFVSQVLHEAFGESEDQEQHWLWIGLNRRNPVDNGWKWSDGLGYSYHNFGHKYYDYLELECAVVDLGTMQWMPIQCESQLDWICKIPRGTVVKEPEEETSLKDWVTFQEAEYKFFDHRSTWDQAQRICSWFESSLASIHSPEEQTFLTQTLRKVSRSEGQHWWVGMHTYENDGRFRWSDRSVLNYVSWAPGRPRPVSWDRKCVYMTSTRDEWGDQKCFTDLPYICKRVNVTGTLPPTPAPPSRPGGCPDGWAPFLHKCYKVFGHQEPKRVMWSGAKLQCESQGANLAVVSSHLEQAFLTTLLANISFDLWIGLSDADVRFQWPDQIPLGYTNWAPGEPLAHRDSSTKTQVNCVVMLHGNPEKNTGMWTSRMCEAEKHGFVCQKRKDPAVLAGPDTLPPSLSGPLQFAGVSYHVLNKRLDWTGALHVCDSLGASLAQVQDPFQAAYLTLVLNALRGPAWIGLHNSGGRSFTWLGEDPLTFTNWRDGVPNSLFGCGHMTTTGQWTVVPCNTKVDTAICQLNTETPSKHQWRFPGHCPQKMGNWGWIPFRNNCYSFNLVHLRFHQEAQDSCRSAGAQLLSILDETENGFVWEHIQAYQEQAVGAWLGMSVNPKGGSLTWLGNEEVEYTNWEGRDANLSMLSANTCFWIQSNTGLWKPGSCRNRTHGVICKRPRGDDTSSPVPESDHLPTLVLVLVTALVLVLLIVGVIYIYRRRVGASRGSYEGARYSRTSASPSEQVEKNILVSDMELNEQPE